MVADRQKSPNINQKSCNIQLSTQQPQSQFDSYLKLDIAR